MCAPRIAPLHQVLAQSPSLVGGLLDDSFVPADGAAFVVVAAGDFEGRWFAVGEIVVCVEGFSAGQAVVLVARSQGRPRLGHGRSEGFLGDRGEPCSPDRWMAAGRVASVWTRDGAQAPDAENAGEGPRGWSRVDVQLDRRLGHRDPAALLEVGASWRGQRWPSPRGAGRSPRPGVQLALFAEAA